MKCGIQKNFWLDDHYVLEKVGVMCALLDLCIIVFEVKNIFCRMLGLCVCCWIYVL